MSSSAVVFAASIVVPTFHINWSLDANTYQKEKQVKPGNSGTKKNAFFAEIWACWPGSILCLWFHAS